MTATACADNLRQYEIRFFFIVEQILAVTSSLNMVSELKICLQISNNLCYDVLRY